MRERGAYFRAKAAELRALAKAAPTAVMAWDLRVLAERYDRLAEHADRWPELSGLQLGLHL